MKDQVIQLSYEIELQPGEKLRMPPTLANSVGPGRWLITVRPAQGVTPVRDHSAFLSGYAPEDEGLYDEHPAG